MSELSTPVNQQDHVQGDARAKVTLLEYGDYQCPSCRQAFAIVHRLQRHFGDQLRFVFRNFPLEQHAMAEPAAEAAEFAATQGKFWEMHDALYENQPKLSEDLLPELATQVGLDPKALTKALASEEFTDRVEADLESGEKSGVHGTPTFFINGLQYEGDYDATSLIQEIEGTLRG